MYDANLAVCLQLLVNYAVDNMLDLSFWFISSYVENMAIVRHTVSEARANSHVCNAAIVTLAREVMGVVGVCYRVE